MKEEKEERLHTLNSLFVQTKKKRTVRVRVWFRSVNPTRQLTKTQKTKKKA